MRTSETFRAPIAIRAAALAIATVLVLIVLAPILGVGAGIVS